jgi:hypothetical protein
MIPFDFLYGTLKEQLFNKINVSVTHLTLGSRDFRFDYPDRKSNNMIVIYDQEPIDLNVFYNHVYRKFLMSDTTQRILISSEYSTECTLLCNDYGLKNVHYFYHGLLCHEWYRMHWYQDITVNTNFERTYITYNNLILDKRLYRANLVVELHKRNLLDSGYASYNAPQMDQLLKSITTYKILPSGHKQNLQNHLPMLKNSLVIDTNAPDGSLSAELDVPLMQKSFVNLVTETIFYENKQHLTEKIFKPIVSKMPFLLLGGAGNLAYLRKYGFKTFGDFWDESYDDISNSSERMDAVLGVLEQLCNKSHAELIEMKLAMADVLEHNFNHFYKGMRPIIVNELTHGLGNALTESDISYNSADLENLTRILTY